MDRAEIDQLVRRLVEDPHDEEALHYAHQAGESDPKSYAMLLERVGTETRDPVYASHWLSEAANVWTSTLSDQHRAARLLMMAIDKDPTQQVAADRLAQLYRDKGDTKALVALLDRRAKALAPLAASQPEIRGELAGMYEELGRLWNDPPLSQPKKALDCFRRAMDLDPTSAYSIFNVRELLKTQGQLREALPLYDAEIAIEEDVGRKIGLYRDQSDTYKQLGDLAAATGSLASARELDAGDPALQQEYASLILERVQAGDSVSKEERAAACDLLVVLAESYEGEHGFAYANAALDIDPGHDRAVQLAAYYGRALGQEADLPRRYSAYLAANPHGAMAAEVEQSLGQLQPDGASSAPVEEADTRNKVLELVPMTQGAPSAPADSLPPSDQASEPMPPTPAPSADTADVPLPSDEAPRRQVLSPDRLQGVLDAAQMLAAKGKKPEAFAKYREALESDPAHPEALAWAEDYLRARRDYAQLRDVILAAVRAPTSQQSIESKKERLREIAGLCEGNLRDIDAAISSWKQLLALDRSDESARTALTRLLEKSQRWDDLASILEQEATIESDIESKVSLERKLAKLQEDKRRDLVGAAEAWGRIARLVPDDEFAIQNATKLFERGERADALKNGKLWEDAERLYVATEGWARAANAATQRGLLTTDAKQEAIFLARAADYLGRVGDGDGALLKLEKASDLDPTNDDYSEAVVSRYTASDQVHNLIGFLSRRGDRLLDRGKRIAARRHAAQLATSRTDEKETARDLWLKVLEDGDDKEALERLVDDAIDREDHTEAATLLRRLSNNITDRAEKARISLREAEILADGVGDVDTAISRYEQILTELDPTCRPALQAIADLQEARDMLPEAAEDLERELKLVADVQERGQIAARLARQYETLGDARSAIRALDLVRKADLEDFDALTRLCELCEQTEQWDRVAELLVERIDVEADEAEVSALTMKLARTLADNLDRGDEALAALTELADNGDSQVRAAYIELGDRLGWKGIVASKLVDWWFEARHGVERTHALKEAFDRFVEVGRDQDAVKVAIELVRTKAADKDLARQLEDLAIKTNDHDALGIAHDLLAREVTGEARAFELVRQAEVRVQVGMPKLDALQHGEAGLPAIPPADAEPLLERLSALAPKPIDVVDLYERQVSRSKAPPDRMRALARAAQIAAIRGFGDRSRGFFDLALAGAPTEETLQLVELAAREGDRLVGGDRLRRALATSMAAGGHGARDGGRTRSTLLRRAAVLIHKDVGDVDQAFSWLGDALVASVDAGTLDALENLGLEVGDPRRPEAAITHALGEVFDGPLVRQLLSRRAKLRREQLVDLPGAAADLKKLHDLSPNDHNVMTELSSLLTDLGDFRALVQIYEDQILRGKDINVRAELARKVARIWEEQLQDARESADAWRRVLRMKAQDPEATQGLERAKSGNLKSSDPLSMREAYAPPRTEPGAAPVPAPSKRKTAPPPVPPVTAPAAAPESAAPRSVPPPLPTAPAAKEPDDSPPATVMPSSDDEVSIDLGPTAPPPPSAASTPPSTATAEELAARPTPVPPRGTDVLRIGSPPSPLRDLEGPKAQRATLEDEIDRSLDMLELPTGEGFPELGALVAATANPEGIATPVPSAPPDMSGMATPAEGSAHPAATDASPADEDEFATRIQQGIPAGLGLLMPSLGSPVTPAPPAEPSGIELTDDDIGEDRPEGPETLAQGPYPETRVDPTFPTDVRMAAGANDEPSREELDEGDLEEIETEHTIARERSSEDDILIADDLAEDVSDMEDTGENGIRVDLDDSDDDTGPPPLTRPP